MGSPAAFTFYIMQTKLIKFHETELPTFVDDEGTIWVAIKPICDGIGLDYGNTLERIKKHEILSELCGKYRIVGKDGALREMVCLPLHYINGWLFSINAKLVSATAKPSLIAYQKMCFTVLFEHFFKAQKPSKLKVIEAKYNTQPEIPFNDTKTDKDNRPKPTMPTMIEQLLAQIKFYNRKISEYTRLKIGVYDQIKAIEG